MKIDIPITDMEFTQLIAVLKKYPRGVVKVEEKKAVWQTELDLSDTNITPSQLPQRQNNQQPGFTGKGNIFSNMADSITSAFGG